MGHCITTPIPCSLRHDASHLGFGGPEPCLRPRILPPSAMRTPRVGFWRGVGRLVVVHTDSLTLCSRHMIAAAHSQPRVPRAVPGDRSAARPQVASVRNIREPLCNRQQAAAP
jgi:hypothetical protein